MKIEEGPNTLPPSLLTVILRSGPFITEVQALGSGREAGQGVVLSALESINIYRDQERWVTCRHLTCVQQQEDINKSMFHRTLLSLLYVGAFSTYRIAVQIWEIDRGEQAESEFCFTCSSFSVPV